VRGIFVEFDLLWMTAFLLGAPCIEILHIQVIFLSVFFSLLILPFFNYFGGKMFKNYIFIELVTQTQVWEHICDVDDKFRKLYTERRTPQWEMHFDGSKNRFLKELEFSGFRSLEQQFTFIRSLLERAQNLQTIILKGDERCESCDALDTPRPSKFPKKDEQEMVVRRIRDGIFSPRIIFDE
jgi:hypothetical protein